MNTITVLDSTLRDGCQGEGITYTVKDKLRVIDALLDLGVAYIEAGNPASNPKDAELFAKLKSHHDKARICAFGATRRKGVKVGEDKGVALLRAADTNTVVIFGKSWSLHADKILHTSLEENLAMIYETVEYFVTLGKEVIFDAEHFFDGYKHNPAYALQAITAAATAGAHNITLCDTNGGAFPDFITMATSDALRQISTISREIIIGIHCHNDGGLAVANTIAAVQAGATHIQGTLLGFGERCGNANLSTLIPNLQLKLGYQLIPPDNLKTLTQTCTRIAEITNLQLPRQLPYIGKSAFAHKAGMHADGVSKERQSFEHIDPHSVGNERRFLMSEIAGRTAIINKVKAIAPELTRESPEIISIIRRVKEMEYNGYQFDGAEGSFELAVYKELGKYTPFFELSYYTVICSRPGITGMRDLATVKIEVDGETELKAAEGNGPVNALDAALRQALYRFYPTLKSVSLIDYKVRVLESAGATASKVRVLIDTSDGEREWTTIGVSTDIIEASWLALVDSIEYKLQIAKNGEC